MLIETEFDLIMYQLNIRTLRTIAANFLFDTRSFTSITYRKFTQYRPQKI